MSGHSFQFHFTKCALDQFLDDADHYQIKGKLQHFRTEIRFLFYSSLIEPIYMWNDYSLHILQQHWRVVNVAN